MVEPRRVRQLRRVVDIDLAAVGQERPVRHRRRRGDQRQVELPLQPLPDDLHVQQPEEPAAEPDAQCVRRLRLEREARIVELEFVQRVAQVGEFVAVDGVQAAEHHRLGVLVPGQSLRCAVHRRRDGLTRPRTPDVLDPCDQVADFPRPQPLLGRGVGRPGPDLLYVVHRSRLHEAQPRPGRSVPSTIRMELTTPRYWS